MKTITIPECMNPYVVILNNHTYTYPAGETLDVPRDVAAVIETHINAMHSGLPSHGNVGEGGGGGADEKAIIEKLAPAFTKTGAVVNCNPVEGHPLEVVSQLTYSNPELLKFAEYTEDDNQGIVYWQVHAPAGEYILWGKSYDDISVEAYDDKSGNWVSIGTLHLTADEEAYAGEDTLTFAHEGGLLRVVASPAYEGATLKLATDPKTFSAAVLVHNGESIMAEFPQAVSNGSFNWSTGVLSTFEGGDNLITDDLSNPNIWGEDDEGVAQVYNFNLPNGKYTLHIECSDWFEFLLLHDNYGEWEVFAAIDSNNNTVTFEVGVDTISNNLRISDISWNPAIITLCKLEAGEEYTGDSPTTYQLTPHEIIGLPGTNTLRSRTGDTEVSGRADPSTVFAEQEARIAALEAALLNG